jgi:D-beta-D-heptose 7-phosphate kinase / D-beta-D-heptose 1-phosphate adenosyltransferase
MEPKPDQLIDAFAGQRVAVLGDAMLDSYLEGRGGRLCREAPVPSIRLLARRDVPGGAANVAVNVRALGGHVVFLSAVGADREGDLLREILTERGVNAEHVLPVASRNTLVKHRVLADSQILLRFDQGDAQAVDSPVEQALIERLERLLPHCDSLIVSDYDYGVVTGRLIAWLVERSRRLPRTLIVDSRRRLSAFREMGATAVKPNYQEAIELLGERALDQPRSRIEQIARQGACILERTGARIAAVTLDEDGAILLERGQPAYRTCAGQARRCCVAGAGDTFTSALALALAAGACTPAAGDLAAAAAAVVVGKEWTAVCSARELRQYIFAEGKHIPELSRLAARVDYYRQQGQRVVFTNGCFDILHRGHITFLNQARTLGDVLIVAVNGDASIERLKGPGRPINALADRLDVLAALDCIDHLIEFQEDTAWSLIRALRPHVFVKGGNYRYQDIPEAPLMETLGGRVEILPYLPNCSTTGLIGRIQRRSAPSSLQPQAVLTGGVS